MYFSPKEYKIPFSEAAHNTFSSLTQELSKQQEMFWNVAIVMNATNGGKKESNVNQCDSYIPFWFFFVLTEPYNIDLG